MLIQLQADIIPKWYQFGEALEIQKEVLTKCSSCPPEESIVEMLDHWLRNYPGRPTWKEVANALKKINLQQLAVDIERVYETGIYVQVKEGMFATCS